MASKKKTVAAPKPVTIELLPEDIALLVSCLYERVDSKEDDGWEDNEERESVMGLLRVLEGAK